MRTQLALSARLTAPGPPCTSQAFFDDLPPDGFLPEEEALREAGIVVRATFLLLCKQWEAILNFLDSSGPDAPPTLKEAQQVSEAGKRCAAESCASVRCDCHKPGLGMFRLTVLAPPFQNKQRDDTRLQEVQGHGTWVGTRPTT